jgi:hypothetical protein
LIRPFRFDIDSGVSDRTGRRSTGSLTGVFLP